MKNYRSDHRLKMIELDGKYEKQMFSQTRVVGRSVKKFPAFWLSPLAKTLDETCVTHQDDERMS